MVPPAAIVTAYDCRMALLLEYAGGTAVRRIQHDLADLTVREHPSSCDPNEDTDESAPSDVESPRCRCKLHDRPVQIGLMISEYQYEPVLALT